MEKVPWDQLNALADRLREYNPGGRFLVDRMGVWLRENGTDYGVFAVYPDGKVACVLVGDKTIMHRESTEGGR